MRTVPDRRRAEPGCHGRGNEKSAGRARRRWSYFGAMRDQADEVAGEQSPALRRVLERAAAEDDTSLLDLLASRLSGADLTTLLLEVFRRRALGQSAAEVMRRYRSDRFVGPSTIPHAALRRAEDALIGALPSSVEMLSFAPLTPPGTH